MLCSTAASQFAIAAEFRSLGDKPAIVYDAPSPKASKIAIVSPFQPFEVLVKLDKWIKIRDTRGEMGWIESAAFGDKRFVSVSTPRAAIHAMPSATSSLVFEAQQQVVLEITGPAQQGWLPVRHRDGQSGFIQAAQVFGD